MVSGSQFTYDFGVKIAQQTVTRITRLAGASLTLASAFYALNRTAVEYNNTLRQNALNFGGILSTMKAMEQAQNRLIKGQSYFSADDQLQGMSRLMSAGVKLGENLDWINKAAHATGRSFTDFSNAITSGISGNMGALVDMGLLTQRATRYFERYPANTIMRQEAILNFVKQHKGLQQLIKNDFDTVQDQMTRIKGAWKGVMQTILGKPNDPSSLMGMTTSAVKGIAEAFSRNYQMMKQYSEGVGLVLGWVVKQIGSVIIWLGRQAKRALNLMMGSSEDFAERMRSAVVWLEFWKLKVKDFFDEYSSLIKGVAKVLLVVWGLRKAFVLSELALTSLRSFNKLLIVGAGNAKTFARMIKGIAKVGIFSPVAKSFKLLFPIAGRFLSIIQGAVKGSKLLFGVLINLPKIMLAGTKALLGFFTASNPIGWIVLAIAALVVLYKKSETFRNFVIATFHLVKESLTLVWNAFMLGYVHARAALSDAWTWLKNAFGKVGTWISDMWNKFKDTSVGKWLDKWIVQPIKWVVNALGGVFKNITASIGKATEWMRGKSDKIALSAQEVAESRGYKVHTIQSNNGTTPITSPELGSPTDSRPLASGNPILQPNSITNTDDNSKVSTVNLSNGAVQIIVHKGEGIDERKLANQVKEILEDIRRRDIVRTGG